MEFLTKKIAVDTNLFLFGDAHVGTVFHNRKGWLQLIDHMRSKIDSLPVEKSNLGVDHGDAIDAIDFLDARFSGESELGTILNQAEQAKKDRIAVAPQLVCCLMGNHELKKRAVGNFTMSMCKALNVPYGGYSCKITYKTRGGNYLFKHMAAHGAKTFNSVADSPKRRRANRLLSLARHCINFPADDSVLMSIGHSHMNDRAKPESDVYWADDNGESTARNIKADHTAEYIHPDLRWYVNCGSFLRYALPKSEQDPENPIFSYAEVRGYRPLRNGYQICKIRSGRVISVEPVWVE